MVMEQQEQQHLVQDQMITLSGMPDITDEMNDLVSIPKEMVLISLVSQEPALYNPKHENYRNTPHKDSRWVTIAENVGLSEAQCKAKWKAMRDQYCRELKRSKFNAKTNVKWKYFKELDFLRPYALSRNYRARHNVNATSNTVISGRGNNNSNVYQSIIAASIGGDVHEKGNLLLDNGSNTMSNHHKFSSIKIETINFNGCGNGGANFTNQNTNANSNNSTTLGVGVVKKENVSSSRLLTSTLNGDQFGSDLMPADGGQWTYLTGTAGTNTTTTTTTALADGQRNVDMSANGLLNVAHAQVCNHHLHNSNAEDVLYSTLVDCVNAATATTAGTTTTTAVATKGHDIHHQQQQQHEQQQPAEEDPDEDPIHTFLNIESYFEKELINMIQQDDILYNCFHQHYRNVKRKHEVWDEIARKLKKTVKQCRLKWKALRDQYIREHKRLKNRENPDSLPRWKHYDALSFLQKFIKHKPSDAIDKGLNLRLKTDLDTDMEEEMVEEEPPLHHSPIDGNALQQQQQHEQQVHHQQHLQSLPSLTGPHTHQQQQKHQQLHATLQQQSQNSNVGISAGRHTINRGIGVVVTESGGGDVSTSAGPGSGVSGGNVSAYDMDIDNYIIGDADDDHEHEQHHHHHHHHQESEHDGRVVDENGVMVSVSGNRVLNETGSSVDDAKMEIHFPAFNQEQSGSNNTTTNTTTTTNNNNSSNNLSAASLDHSELDKSVIDDNDDDVDGEEFVDIKVRIHECNNSDQAAQAMSVNVSLDDATASLEESLKAVVKRQVNLPTEYNHARPTSLSAASNGTGHLLNGLVSATTPSVMMKSGNQSMSSPTVCSQSQSSVAMQTTNHGLALNTSTPSTNSGIVAVSNHLSHDDDDEVGAFFRAVAMKIRNAQMSPIAFTDLQINILQVINGSLRNH